MNKNSKYVNDEVLLELKKQNEKLDYLSDGLVDHSSLAAAKIITDSLFSFSERFPALITLFTYIGFIIIGILLYVIFIDNNILNSFIR